MARPKKQAEDATAPVPVRFSQKMRGDLKRLSEKKEMAQQDLIRLAAEVGLKVLAKTDFNVAEAIARYAFELSGEEREELERLRISAPQPDNIIEEPENLLHPSKLKGKPSKSALTPDARVHRLEDEQQPKAGAGS